MYLLQNDIGPSLYGVNLNVLRPQWTLCSRTNWPTRRSRICFDTSDDTISDLISRCIILLRQRLLFLFPSTLWAAKYSSWLVWIRYDHTWNLKHEIEKGLMVRITWLTSWMQIDVRNDCSLFGNCVKYLGLERLKSASRKISSYVYIPFRTP